MKINFNRICGWLLVNIVGMLLYLCGIFWLLLPRSEVDSLNSFDVIHFWFIIECPILIAFIIINIIWLISTLGFRHRYADRQSIAVWVIAMLIWVGIVVGNGIGIGMCKVLIILISHELSRMLK